MSWFTVLVSRRNAPDISYATWDPPPLPSLSAKLRAAEDLASGATTMAEPSPTLANFAHKDGLNRLPPFRTRSDSLAPFFVAKPNIKADDNGIRPARSAARTTIMTRGSVGRSGRKRKAIDQLEWLGGVTTVGLAQRRDNIPVADQIGSPRYDAKGKANFLLAARYQHHIAHHA
jgi:hypothetical protein